MRTTMILPYIAPNNDKHTPMKSTLVILLLVGLSRAVRVYLSPPSLLPSSLNTEQASFAISRHLGLEEFEPIDLLGESLTDVFNEHQFVGRGSSNAVLLTLDDVVAKDVLPSSLKPSFSLLGAHDIDSLSSVVSTYLHRARDAYESIYASFSQPTPPPRLLDLFSIPSPSTQAFVMQIGVLSEFVDVPSASGKFAAIELTGLSDIVRDFGRTSEQYKLASRAIRAMLESVMAHPSVHLALLTFTSASTHQDGVHKREEVEPPQTPLPVPNPVPQQPISGISTCFATEDACSNSTMSCSGRGQCLQATKAGRSCYVCSCRTTMSEAGKKETWAGDACERKDISGPFTLIAGTTVGLILLMGAAVSLLANAANEELPSVLLAGASAGEGRD